jgi:hypothetical protein
MTSPDSQIYIRPTLHIHPNLAAAKEITDTYGTYHFWSDKESVEIRAAAAGKRNLTLNELHPSWFSALTFLVDMHGELLESNRRVLRYPRRREEQARPICGSHG